LKKLAKKRTLYACSVRFRFGSFESFILR